ncbi:MAG: transposase [Acidimicrobiia bacterium]
MEEADRATAPGEIGALLRREGLYSSHLVDWRRQRDEGRLAGRPRGRRGRDPKDAEIEQLRRENDRLRRRLEQAETVIEVQKNSRGRLGSTRGRPGKARRSDRCRRGAGPGAWDQAGL